MPPSAKDRGSRWQIPFFTGLLILLGVIAHSVTWREVDPAGLGGTYQRGRSFFLPMDSVPEEMVLHADGRLEFLSGSGRSYPEARWTLDPQEHVLRTDDPRWDRQVRVRRSWTGIYLSVRIFPGSLTEELEERDDEIRFIRSGPEPGHETDRRAAR